MESPGPAAQVEERWSDAEAGARYARRRFRSSRAAGRDPRLVAALMSSVGPSAGPVLDVPCGAGRLRPGLSGDGLAWTGCDASPAMLAEAARGGAGRLVRASVFALPFADRSFDAVVCCRLLHHLEDEDVRRAVRELARVSARVVVASFWDAASLSAWRRRRRPRLLEVRRAVPKRLVADAFERAGFEVRAWRHSLRFVSQQAFAAAVRKA